MEPATIVKVKFELSSESFSSTSSDPCFGGWGATYLGAAYESGSLDLLITNVPDLQLHSILSISS